jgi:pimeloyl-ACP methyl ester carboxylesterase
VSAFPSDLDSAALTFGQAPAIRALAAALRRVDRIAPQLAAAIAVRLFFTPFPTKRGNRRRVPEPWRLQPLAVQDDRVTLLRHAIAARDARRPRVLLVHGWAGHALQLRAIGEALAAGGFDPVLLDLPAHGRSRGWTCTMPQIVRSLFAAQAQLGGFAAVVAHSMGAVATLHATTRGLAAGRLAILAPSSSPASVLGWFCEVCRLGEPLRMRMRHAIESLMPLAEFEHDWLGARVAVPTLLIHDRDDRIAPIANTEALGQQLPQARTMITQGLSHRGVNSDPAVIAAIVAHLRDRAG